jgi:tetratricopeptide (TPR) repeat protein
MNFMMISLVVMLISVLVIFKITNHFGLQLKIKPLLLCAFCAFWINLITLCIASYLTVSNLWFIFCSVLGSACAVTFYNEKLTTSRSDADALEIPKSSHIVPNIEETIPVIGLPRASATETLDEMRTITEYTSCERIDERFTVKSFQVAESSVCIQKQKLPLDNKLYLLPVLITPTIEEQIEKDFESMKKQKLSNELEKLDSLDEILDYAYGQKDQGQYVNSLFAFEHALRKYSNDEYAPFIIIEMGNIYKNIGFYDEALTIYAKAFSLSYVAVNNIVKEKFQMEINYLRIIKVILQEHNCFKKPFNQISQSIMQKIEAAFQAWQEKQAL